jgi:hypothetical protein
MLRAAIRIVIGLAVMLLGTVLAIEYVDPRSPGWTKLAIAGAAIAFLVGIVAWFDGAMKMWSLMRRRPGTDKIPSARVVR